MSLSANTAWNLAGAGLPLLVGLVAVPYILAHTGVEAFGILTLVWSLIGYFSLFDFGLGRALTHQVAQRLSHHEKGDLSALVISGLATTGMTGLAGGLLLAVLSYPLSHAWLNVSPALQEDAFHSLLIASIGIPFVTCTSGIRGVIEAYQHFRGINLLRIALGLANFLLPALCAVLLESSLSTMVLSLIGARALAMAGHVWLLGKKMPLSWSKDGFKIGEIRRLFSFGAWMTLSNIISPLMVTADRFVISSVLGASVVAYYTLPFEFLSRILMVPAALTTALFPRIASMAVQDKEANTSALYARSMKIIAIFMFGICASAMACSKFGLTLWLGESFASQSWLIVCILSVGLFFNGVAFVPFTMIQATGRARTTALIHLTEVTLYFPVLFACLHYFGVKGAAVAWSLRAFADFLLMLSFAALPARASEVVVEVDSSFKAPLPQAVGVATRRSAAPSARP
jgi:O-antigen/teichoic acid export membrane protein